MRLEEAAHNEISLNFFDKKARRAPERTPPTPRRRRIRKQSADTDTATNMDEKTENSMVLSEDADNESFIEEDVANDTMMKEDDFPPAETVQFTETLVDISMTVVRDKEEVKDELSNVEKVEEPKEEKVEAPIDEKSTVEEPIEESTVENRDQTDGMALDLSSSSSITVDEQANVTQNEATDTGILV